ncbi:hypothetical protein SAMN05216466_106106 [Paraburkholderia phenazinium]|uniref:Uncharacterized protein n=1 Tax=Paraburkholderia phenazinium TaxID=60549 RepID=A0A1G7YAD4_9BURK|nr:hypothetical protein [Paraburkholderia phenazinium]SDG93442.1 hypothetical protein SAMN05216466_106106 [Paraburkholderia phenazinium]
MFKSRKFLTTLLALAGLALGTVQAHADTTGNPQSTPYRYDAQHRLTLAGVPVGVALEAAIPACTTAPETAHAPCHGPVGHGGWSMGDADTVQTRIYGAQSLMAFQGAPFKAEVWATMDNQSHVIEAVYVDLSEIVKGGKLPFTAIVPMVQTFGSPRVAGSMVPGVIWRPSDDRVVMMFDNELFLYKPAPGDVQ